MRKRLLKKTILVASGICFLLLLILGIHIYSVTRPKAPSASSVAMARIDLRQDIDQAEANKITDWLYQQDGVSHVLCNPATDIVVFSFYPSHADASGIAERFAKELHYPFASRYIPSKEELQSGCPVATNSVSYKVYKFFKNIF